MIRFFHLADFDIESFDDVVATFPPLLKQKVFAKSDKKRQMLCVFEYFCLQKMLHLENLNELRFSKNGKPYISNAEFFNISNDEDVFCISVAKRPVGVDIQKITPYDEEMAKKVCNEKELAHLKKQNNKDIEFTKIWTEKESLIKCMGETIGQDMKGLLGNAADFKFRHFRIDNFIACECLAGFDDASQKYH